MNITEVLEFERSWWQQRGSKESEIQSRFGVSPTRYYQQLNQIVDMPEALAIDPMVVKRLRRLREQRARTHRRMAAGLFPDELD